jgi:hypothetical protein
MTAFRTRTVAFLVIVAASIGMFPSRAGALPSPHTSRHTSYLYWLNGSSTCWTEDSHGMLLGSAQAHTWTVTGQQACWGTYTGLYSGTPDRYDESTTSDPNSAVTYSGTQPEDSRHLGCWGLFNCAPAWALVDY